MSVKEWTELNKPFGIELGYPECCIDEFCSLSPGVLATRKSTKNDEKKARAAYIGSEYSGFIPCLKHAKQINRGEITLQSLIKNRSSKFPPFPNF